MRPCKCDNVSGAMYLDGDCRLCWKWYFDPSYRRHWGGTSAISLPCVHLGEPTGERLPCTSCKKGTRIKLFSCSLHASCSTHKPLPAVACCEECPDRLPIGPTVTRIEGLSPGRSFNGSIAEWKGKTYLCYRKFWSNARLAIVELGRDWRAVGLSKPLALGKLLQDRDGQEDPRFFVFRDQLYFGYTGCNWRQATHQVSVCAARLNADLDVEESFYLPFDGRAHWEKNWGWFDHEGDLYCVYEINPHRVLMSNSWRHAWELPTGLPPFLFPSSPYGLMRGGSCPSRHGDEYYSFFHGISRDDLRYSIGLYTFEATPPFRPRRWCPVPLLWPDPADWPGPHVANVVFPGGAILRDGQWHVSYGYYDQEVRVASWDARHIEKLLEPV